jgi:hypothetical protein
MEAAPALARWNGETGQSNDPQNVEYRDRFLYLKLLSDFVTRKKKMAA